MPTALVAPQIYSPPTVGTYTARDLLTHPEWGPCELIRGKVVAVCRPNSKHGRLVISLGGKLDTFVEIHKLGMVFSDSGVLLEKNPDTVRGPDLYFVRADRCPVGDEFDGYVEHAPDLCVEIVSPRDRPSDLQEKIEQYLHFGVKLIWVIDPMSRTCEIHRLDGTVETIPASGTLNGEDVLPGFELTLTNLFSALDRRA